MKYCRGRACSALTGVILSMVYDVIIVGAGAAGLMTAITAANSNLSILVLEGQRQAGTKILMSGGTRCNVTNKAVSEKDFNSSKIIYVRNILRSFSNTDTIAFFKDLGVELVLEATGKYFPSTGSGKTILEALLRKISTSDNVTLLYGRKVKAMGWDHDEFILKGDDFQCRGRNIVLTTGGLSYPDTGSDGTGYRLAQSFGHAMVETTPALSPLSSNDKGVKALSGLTLEVRLTLTVKGQRDFSVRDSFLFTHFGFSGPAALDISRHYLRSPQPKQILANFIPDHDESSLLAYFGRTQQESGRKTIKNVLVELLPQRLADLILKKTGIDASLAMNQLNKVSRQRLVDQCLHYPLEVSGVLGYTKAEATAGGVGWDEIDPKTLGSKLMPGLFMAGEILDVDGRIGGFNFQWAWASGHTVGEALIKKAPPGQMA